MRTKTPQKRVQFTHTLRVVALGVFAVFAIAITLSLLRTGHTSAATSSYLNFQARLETSSGAIVPDGSYNVTFKLYNAATSTGSTDTSCSGDANCLWVEQHTYNSGPGSTDARIRVANGYLTVSLGSITAFGAINWNQQLWLTMNIGGTSNSSVSWDGEMSPRIQLTAVPYAFQAGALGNGTNQAVLDASGNLTLQQASTISTSTGQLTVQGATSLILQSTGANAATLDSGTTGNVNVGTGSNAKAVAIGNTTGATSLSLQGGTGGINLGTGGIANTIQIGNITGAVTQAINIGTNATASSTSTITVGSTVAGTLQLQSAGGVIIGKASSVNGTLIFDNTAGTNTVTLAAQAVNPASSVSIYLPTTGATATQCLLSTSGSTSSSTTLQFGSCLAGNTLTTVYNNGAGQADSTINLDSTRKGVIIADNSTPLTTNGLFTVQNNVGTAKYLDVRNNGFDLLGSGVSTITTNSGNLTLDVTSASTPTLNIGTGSQAKNIVIGNTTGTTSVQLQAGSGGVKAGTNGTATGQLYVSGALPTSAIGSVATGTLPITLYVQGRYAYVVNYTSATLQVFDVSSPASPLLVGSVSTNANPSSVYVQGHYAYVVAFGTSKLQIFDISNPASPSIAGSVSTNSGPYMVYAQGRYAYVTNYTNGDLQIFDVSNPAAPVSVASTGVIGTHPEGVYVQGGYAYVVTLGSNTLKIFNVSNPASPSLVSTYTTSSGSPAGTAPNDIYVQGRYAYVTYDTSNNMQIIDISNPASPTLAGTVTVGTNPFDVFVQDRYAYVANNATDTMQVIDVSNPASPVSVGTVSTGAGSTPNDIYVQGRYAYVVASGGNALKVYDMGGEYSQQFEAGGVETGTLQVSSNASIFGSQNIQGSLTVGQSAKIDGNLGVSGAALFSNSSNSTTAFQVQNASGTSILTADTTNKILILGSIDNATKVGVGIAMPVNAFSVSPLDYNTGTACSTATSGGATCSGTSTTFLLGSGTTWTSTMVGDVVVFADGTTSTISTFTDATHVTLSSAVNEVSGSTYWFHHTGLQVTSAGQVGIGLTSPSATLHLYNPLSSSGDFMIVQGNSSALRLGAFGGVNYVQSGTALSSGSSADLQFTDMFGAHTWLTIQATTGDVGIGTTSPLSTLDVKTGTDQHLRVESGGVRGVGSGVTLLSTNDADSTYKPIAIEASILAINNAVGTGRVGIGTAGPNTNLQVAANGGSLFLGDNTNTSVNASYNSLALVGYDGSSAVLQGASGKGIHLNVNNSTFGSGTVATIDTSGNFQFQQASTINVAASAAGAVLTIKAGDASSSTNGGNLILQGGAGSVSSSGSVIVASNTFNSISAFQVQNTNGSTLLNVDTKTTSNMISNPDFETNTTGWLPVGTGAGIGLNTFLNDVYAGVGSLKVTTGTSSNSGASVSTFGFTISPGTYTLSFYAMSDSVNFNDLTVVITGGGPPTCALNTNSVSTSGFQHYYCTFTSTGTNITAVLIGESGTTPHAFYLDSVQLSTSSTLSYQAGTIALNGIINNPVVITNNSNSVNAFQVQNVSSVSLLSVDSTNTIVQVGSATTDSTGVVLVLDSYNQSGDPAACTNGGVYYNTNSSSFRACKAGSWVTLVAGVDVQDFTTPGSGNSWTRPSGVSVVLVIACGAGGGGGGGRSGTAPSTAQGGSGGGGGAYVQMLMTATNAGSSQTVTVGTGGTGGAANNNGTAGSASTFGGLLHAGGGGQGFAGPASATNISGGGGGGMVTVGGTGASGSASTGGENPNAGASGIAWSGGGSNSGGAGLPAQLGGGGGGGVSSGLGTGFNGGDSIYGGAGGGGGGSVNGSGTQTSGGGGGTNGTYTSGGGAGGGGSIGGGTGGTGSAGNSSHCGKGGGGGGSNSGGTGGTGGAGGATTSAAGSPGGGGGGGGGGTTGGTGGAGARGEVWVISW